MASMLRREKLPAPKRAAVVQTLMLQGILAIVIVVAAFYSLHNPVTFWLTLSLLALPIAITTRYLMALKA